MVGEQTMTSGQAGATGQRRGRRTAPLAASDAGTGLIGIAQALAAGAAKPDGRQRATLDQAVDRLLAAVGDGGLWADDLQVTHTVVVSLIAYLPAMPATRRHYVRQALQRTAARVRVMAVSGDGDPLARQALLGRIGTVVGEVASGVAQG